MVQQITPTRLSDQLGQALQQGAAKGSEMGVQRGMLQNALGDLGNLPKGATAFDLAKSLISATAGIPGAERYVGQLFPLLLQQMRGESVDQPGGVKQPGGQHEGQTPGQFPEAGGFLTPPMTQQEKLEYSKRFGLGSPEDQVRGLQIANELSTGSQQNLQYLQERAKSLGVTEKELPYFTQIAQKSPERNPEKLITNTMRELEDIRALDNALVPGLLRGTLQKTGVGGLIPALLAGGKDRETAVRGLQPVIGNLLKKGYEPIVRDKLAALDLSRTEIEDLIHPLSKEVGSRISSFPKSSKDPARNERLLQDFFEKNLKPDGEPPASLLVLRHKLWKEKGYDWQQIRNGFQRAIENGLPITQSQSTELTEFSSQPPRESLMDIFKEWGRPFDYLRGKK